MTRIKLILCIGVLLACSPGDRPFAADKKGTEPVWKGPDADSKPIADLETIAAQKGAFVALAKKVNPAVVNIYTTKKVRARPRGAGLPPGHPFQDFFDQFMGPGGRGIPREAPEQQSLGTGFIINPDGFVVTNNHVIEGADEIKVKVSEGKSKKDEFIAKLVGSDPSTDIALLKIEPKEKLPYLVLGHSEGVEVGEWVMAVGNPFGLGHTVTVGIISAKGRDLSQQLGSRYTDFLQTDAAINPGNSGGPLLNLSGQVIGINSAINAQANNIGFAIPSDLAKRILSDLQMKGKVVRGWIGVSMGPDVDERIAKHYGFKGDGGVLIQDVVPNNPAEKAGMRAEDIVTEINGKKVRTQRDLLMAVADLSVGTKVPVKVFREGKEIQLTLTVTERRDEGEEVSQAPSGSTKGDPLGIDIQQVPSSVSRQLGIPDQVKGVVIVNMDPEGLAYQEGLRVGDVIVMVNKKAIQTARAYRDEIKKTKKSVMLRVWRQGTQIMIVIPLAQE